MNGIVYEALRASIDRRPRNDLYHSVLRITLPHGIYWVEMTPALSLSHALEAGRRVRDGEVPQQKFRAL